MPNHEVIDTATAARLLQRSPRTVHRLVASGALLPVHHAPGGPHGSYLFSREDVDRLAGLEPAEATS